MIKDRIQNIPKKIWLLIVSIFILLAAILAIVLTDSRHQQKDYLNQVGVKQLDLKPTQLNTNAKSAIVVDANSGQILSVQNPNQKNPIASISKLMTAELVYQAIDSGKITLKTEVTIPEYAANLNNDPDLSNAGLVAHQKYSVESLLDSMLMDSANDAGTALADFLTNGNSQKFADMMNQQAKKWEMQDSFFINAVGLNNRYLADHKLTNQTDESVNVSTASDVAKMTQAIFLKHPEILKITQASAKIDFDAFNQQSPDFKLIAGKSGSSEEAGSSFSGLAKNKAGVNLIVVVLNAGDYQDLTIRYTTAGQCLSQSLESWQPVHFSQGQQLNFQQNLIQTKQDAVDLIVAKDQTFWHLKKDQLPIKENDGLLLPNVNHDVKSFKQNQPFENVNLAGFKNIKTIAKKSPAVQVTSKGDSQEANFVVKIWREVLN